ncbi:MAG: metal ABC transporter ATP-binding protein [Lachnospiraceae bacterium]|nr:metal ABC transporter ATP-binding protein [Lachnospiraceae bacterium]
MSNKFQLPNTPACGLHCIKVKDFGVKMGVQTIIEQVNIHVHCGEITAIIGKNGAGKTTLIKAINGDVKHDGKIEFKDMKEGKFKNLKIGYVPQALNIEKNTPTSVYDMFASYTSKYPVFLPKRKALYEQIKNHLKLFDAEQLIDKCVCDLSGGELQRVLLSLAMAPIPNLLLLDEPVSGIDNNGMDLFYKNITKLKKKYDLAIILVSHDLDYVLKYADNVVLLDKTVIKSGKAKEVYQSKEFKDTFGNMRFEELGE